MLANQAAVLRYMTKYGRTALSPASDFRDTMVNLALSVHGRHRRANLAVFMYQNCYRSVYMSLAPLFQKTVATTLLCHDHRDLPILCRP